MWVRSQDSKILEDVSCFIIDSVYYNDGFYYINLSSSGLYLGKYSTEVKASKVLDMIQYNIASLNYKQPSWMNNYVFKMPHDDDVK